MHGNPDNILEHEKQIKKLEQEIDEMLRRVDALQTIDSQTVDEILDYDENGLPH